MNDWHKERSGNTLAEDALAAEARGESLIAVGADKRPWYSWKPYQTKRAAADQLLMWSKDPRTTAFAVVTGKISGFNVVDFDEEGVSVVEKYGLSPHVRTGRGFYHLRVRHPGFAVSTQNSKVTQRLARDWPGVDVRADGGYAIEFGRSALGYYEPLRDLSDIDEIDVLPEDLAGALGMLEPTSLDDLEPEAPSGKAKVSEDGMYHEGHRYRHLLVIASAMAGRGRSETEILAELRRVNAAECVPPKDDKQLVDLAKDVAKRYGAAKPEAGQEGREDRERLEQVLRLAQHDVHVQAVRLIGNGSTAGLEIDLSNGVILEHERFGELWTHGGLAKFVTQGTGINASGIGKQEAGEANAIIRRLARAQYATTIRDLGIDNGIDFLTRATVMACNVTAQADRYRAWAQLAGMDPIRESDPRLERDKGEIAPATVADASLVIEHTDGRRLVRCDWLFAHVRRLGEVSHPAELARRMEHAGWTRPGSRGRMKATSTGMGKPIVLPMWMVPAGWEESL